MLDALGSELAALARRERESIFYDEERARRQRDHERALIDPWHNTVLRFASDRTEVAVEDVLVEIGIPLRAQRITHARRVRNILLDLGFIEATATDGAEIVRRVR